MLGELRPQRQPTAKVPAGGRAKRLPTCGGSEIGKMALMVPGHRTV